MTKTLIYDCEIIKCIPGKNGYKKPEFEYCAGWNDHANMDTYQWFQVRVAPGCTNLLFSPIRKVLNDGKS